ncbi:MAG TPA: sulfate adenylyltransferase subunit CysD [Candidatus Dormibacteraeota bacterium]|nr:sulfate adenylyltransferase subunit CysD [Candidatus Dormibacteraeota bacterium]
MSERSAGDLDALESQTIFILREAFACVSPLAMLWSIGKDSTALLWMVRKAFLGEVPFPLVLLDTGMEFDEVYAFRDRIVSEWALPVVNESCPPESTVDQSLPVAARHAARKTAGLRSLLEREKYRGIILGIRRDEQAIRAKERIFSPRNADGSWDPRTQPPELWDYYSTEVPDGAHVRIHPLLHWTERDIWRYTQREGIPYVSLYLAKNGKRYRSLGESNITFPIESGADTIEKIITELDLTKEPERAGRAMDAESEDAFERLRTGGYM